MHANTPASRLPVSRRVSRYAAYPAHGPTIAIENAFAPSVVRPPWASSNAWNSSTTVPSSAITGGLNRTAPRPVPVGWLELPVTEGSLIALSTKVNAPAAPSSRVDSGFSRTSLATARAPCTTNGAAAIVQPMACAGGRNPSAMCTQHLRSGRDEAGGHLRRSRPVQVQVAGLQVAGHEALGPVGVPLPGGRGWRGPAGGRGGGGAVELVPAPPGAGRGQHAVGHGDRGPVAQRQP